MVLIVVAVIPQASITPSLIHAIPTCVSSLLCKIRCSKGGIQKLTSATEKHPTNASTFTKLGKDTLIKTVIRQMVKRTITFAWRLGRPCATFPSISSAQGTTNKGAVACESLPPLD